MQAIVVAVLAVTAFAPRSVDALFSLLPLTEHGYYKRSSFAKIGPKKNATQDPEIANVQFL